VNQAAAEQRLLERVARGDEDAFLELYRGHQAAVFRYARHMAGDEAMAADVVQETFLALLRQAGNLDTRRGAVAAWLFAVARKQVLRHLARAGRAVEMELDFGEVAAERDLELDVARDQEFALLREAVGALPFLYREAVVLCDLQGMRYEDAAEAMGCPVGTVRSRLHRGRGLLAEKLEPILRGTR
jgi:RNA polymerase sigma-70 factor, ECF subfamily